MARPLIGFILSLGKPVGPDRVEGDAADVDGGQLFYESGGAGAQAVVLVHDGLIDSSGFDEMWPILCKDFHVVRYDRRGYGKSPAARGPYSQTDDLAAVVAAAGLDRFSLVGFSAGGGIALDYALDNPERVDRLVLVGSTVSGLRPSPASDRRSNRNFLPILFGNVDGVAANWAKDPYQFAPGSTGAREKALAIWKASPQNIRHLPNDPAKTPSSALPRLQDLRVPTLVVAGDRDFPEIEAAAALARIPNARRVVVADCGHLPQLEHPQQTAAMIGAFIRNGC